MDNQPLEIHWSLLVGRTSFEAFSNLLDVPLAIGRGNGASKTY